MNTEYTNQIQILHLSDIHFGEHHICNPPPTASKKGIPSLSELLIKDLQTDFGATVSDNTDYTNNLEAPLIIAVSGDFTQRAAYEEFFDAEIFLNEITSNTLLNQQVARKNVYMIPGNHDVTFSAHSTDERFQQYSSFYNKFYRNIRKAEMPDQPIGFTQIHLSDLNGNKVLIAEINCSMYVEKDKIDASRGQVDMEGIAKLRRELNAISAVEGYNDYIKIAIMHHHIVLLPSFIESNRGIDSIMNAGYLLELLSEHNFHLILHGHKHYPQIFNYEPLPLWSESSTRISQLVISGGSCGSNELPNHVDTACNTYSVINIKWHPAAKQARVKVITRGLVRKGKTILAPDQWHWKTVNISEKILTPYQTIPAVGEFEVTTLDDDSARVARYSDQRGMMPVVEVMPSLIPGQAYEVRAWIVAHKPEVYKLIPLKRVEWTAGKMFKKVICERETNPNFSMSYQYWGPMLIQSKLFFEDGHIALAYVYARMPKDEVSHS